VFRLAETEFKSFIEKLTDLFTEVDPQIPPLPPKDLIYRIYRDVRPTLLQRCSRLLDTAQVRFSNDKTPYKTNFSASFSRSGRKGIFAGCRFLCASINSQFRFNTLIQIICAFVLRLTPFDTGLAEIYIRGLQIK
jgi:uncharacterized protein (DUF2461 family)